jgi:CubicO group peptidase (beta-lactamase class C family)
MIGNQRQLLQRIPLLLFFLLATLGLPTEAAKQRYEDLHCPWRSTPRAMPLPPTVKAKLDELATKITTQFNTLKAKGYTIALSSQLAYRGEPVYDFNIGSTDYRTKSPPTSKTPFLVGSVSKLLTAVGVFVDDDAGKIDLDAPLTDYVPAFKITNTFNNDAVTLRQLAEQRSGLPREAPCAYGACNVTTAEMLPRIAKQLSMVAAPGGRPSYSNLGYALLGHAAAANQYGDKPDSYAQWLIDTVAKPLNLDSIGFDVVKAWPHMAKAYVGNTTQTHGPFDAGWGRPMGGAFASVSDLNKLTSNILASARGGDNHKKATRLMSQAQARSMLSIDYVNNDGRTLYGAPWESFRLHNYTVLNKGGNVPGCK